MSLTDVIEYLNKKKLELNLKSNDVLEIFNSNIGHTKISRIYNISRNTVMSIRSGKTWSSITGKKQ